MEEPMQEPRPLGKRQLFHRNLTPPVDQEGGLRIKMKILKTGIAQSTKLCGR